MEARYRRRAQVAIRPTGDGDFLAYDGVERKVHVLNQSAAFVLEELQDPRSVPEIFSRVHEVFGVSEETSRPEIEAIVQQFATIGLVDVVTSDGQAAGPQDVVLGEQPTTPVRDA